MKAVVVGTGSIGLRHLSVLRGGGVPALALPKRSERAAELRQLGYDIADSLGHAADAGVRRAIIASDTRLHASDTLAALDCQMAALVEKPLTAELGEAQKLRAMALAAGAKIHVGCTLRFSESLGQFREWLPELGAVHSVQIECQSYLPDWRPSRPYRECYSARLAEGGVVRDLIHEIDYAGWLFGWPDRVQATLRNLGRLDIEAEETADLYWLTPAGAAVVTRLDYLGKPARRSMLAAGERGSMHWDAISNSVTLRLAGEPESQFVSAQTRDEMLYAQDTAFIAAERDADSRLASLDDAVRAVAIFTAARLSSQTRREEPVTPL